MALLLNAGDTVSRSYSYTQPSPLHPSQPQGTGERTENLFDVNRLPSDTWTIDDKYYIDGAVGDSKSSIRPDTVDVSISNSGDLTVRARSYYGAGFVIPVTPNTTYTISFTTDTAVSSSKSIATITYVNADKDFLNYITIYGDTTSVTFTTPNTAYYILITFRYTSNTITYSDIMLSSTALPYEPYGYKIPISSANTTTPVYLGEVQTTRAIRKYVFNGTEGWQRTSNGAYYLPSTSNPMSNYKYISADISINSHFPSQGTVTASSFVNDGKSAFFYIASSGTREYYIAARNIPTAADFKSYLAAQYAAGTPVTVWYVLATPQTAITNEPLMKIGSYSDSLTTSIPCTAGENTLDVQTTVQPSEVSAGFSGWHPVQSVHERENGQWD